MRNGLCLAILLNTSAGALLADPAFDAQVRETLLRKPEIILEVFAVLERQNDERQRQKDAALISSVADDLFAEIANVADNSAPIVVEFVDYNCAYCRRSEVEVEQLLASHPSVQLKVVQFPILGEQSVEVARLALAAQLIYGEETYQEISRALLQGGAPAMQNVDGFLSEMGFDVAELRAGSADPRIDHILNTTSEIARRLNITGTPGFVTKTQIHRGFVPADALTESALRTRKDAVVHE